MSRFLRGFELGDVLQIVGLVIWFFTCVSVLLIGDKSWLLLVGVLPLCIQLWFTGFLMEVGNEGE